MADQNNTNKSSGNDPNGIPAGAKILGVRKIVTNPDGSTAVRVVYGSMPDEENVDRSITIACKRDETLPYFLRALVEGTYSNIPSDDPDREKTHVLTVELMDMPLTEIVTLAKDKWVYDAYGRDMMHSTGDSIVHGEWATAEDGGMDITGEALRSDRALVYSVVTIQMVKFLQSLGLSKELRQLDDRGAMALIEVKDGKPEARIVRGRQRPDLPCTMLLAEEPVMARPYMDEMLGGVRLNGMSFEEIEREAEKGDENAIERAAMACLNGDNGVEQDAEKAAVWFKKLAESGNSEGMFNYGLFCAKGFGVKRDFAEAAKWLRKAEAAGDEDAAAFAEKMDNMNRLTALAEQGKAAAQGQLAGLYMELAGSLQQAGPGDDYAMAFKWATRAGEQDDPLGLWTLALAYEHGRGVKRNTRMALECYERSANLGFARAKNSLGCFYLRGEVPGHTIVEGFELVKAAAEAGDPEGMANLGRCYQFETGTDHDMGKAIEWYEKALDAGLDNPELAQKLPIYKMMEQDVVDHGDADPYAGMNPPIDFKPLSPWEHIEEHMSWQDNDNIQMLGVAKQRRTPGEKPEGFFIDAIDGGVRIVDIEISNTQFQGRVQRIERVREGQAVKIDPCTTRDDRLEVFTLDGQSLGELTHGGDFILDVLNEGTGEVTGAKVSYVVPVSKRGPRAKKAELYIDVDLKRKKPETEEERIDRERREAEAREAEAKEAELQRQKEEAERRAREQREAEERARRQAEAQAKAERQRQQAKAEAKRRAELEQADREKYDAFLAQFEKARADCKAEKDALSKRLNDRTAELNAMGIFKLSAKKQAKADIESLSMELNSFPQKERRALEQVWLQTDMETREAVCRLLALDYVKDHPECKQDDVLRQGMGGREFADFGVSDANRALEQLIKDGRVVRLERSGEVYRCLKDDETVDAVMEAERKRKEEELRKEEERKAEEARQRKEDDILCSWILVLLCDGESHSMTDILREVNAKHKGAKQYEYGDVRRAIGWLSQEGKVAMGRSPYGSSPKVGYHII